MYNIDMAVSARGLLVFIFNQLDSRRLLYNSTTAAVTAELTDIKVGLKYIIVI